MLTVRFDRVGATYYAGETITGVVVVTRDSSTSHNGLVLDVKGEIVVQPSVRGLASFEEVFQLVKPVRMVSHSIVLSPKGERIPAGTVELPFSFPLIPTGGPDSGPLVETYNGVFVASQYYATATCTFSFSKQSSVAAPFLVICRGQSAALKEQCHPNDTKLHEFLLEEKSIVNTARKALAPSFRVVGAISLINDIDVPLSGYVEIQSCNSTITSVELQLIRVESAAAGTAGGKEATEIQNIQIGDGDVPRGWRIPIYMFFPRWFTCPTIRTPNIRVDFECNLVITLAEKTQITQNFPLILYRAAA